MTEPNDIPERVSRLEREVAEVRKDAAAARVLAGGADRDVAEIRTELKAHTKLLEALRQTQVEHRDELKAEIHEGDASIRAEMREGFAKVGVGMAQINALLKIAIGQRGEPEES